MDVKNFVGLLVFGVVGVIVLAAFVPIISETTTPEKTFQNVGSYFMTDVDDTYTLTYDPSGKFIANGEDIAFTDFPAGDRTTIVSTQEFLIRFAVASNVNYAVAFVDAENWGNLCDSTQAYTTTLTFNNGTLTVSSNGTDTTHTYTSDSFRGLVKNGGYVMTKANTPTKVNSDTTIIVGNGLTQVTTWHDRFYIEGTVENMNVTAPEGITVSDVVVNTTPIDDYVDLVEFTSIQFKATDGENNVDATYNRVIVPSEVTVEKATHPDPALSAVIDLLPLIAGIGLMVILVAEFLYSRYL